MDGHNSRWTYEGLTHLSDNNVVVICLPSHTSIITQPNDNGTNAKFHQHTGDGVQRWREQHAGLKLQKADANKIICAAWSLTEKESATITKGFNSSTCGICPTDRNALNYRDLLISEAVNPEQEAEKAKTLNQHAVRAKAHAEYIYFKRRHGTDIVALRKAILEESQRHWLRSAKEIAEVRSARSKISYSGIPNTQTGACCTAKDFRDAICAYEVQKANKLKVKDDNKQKRADGKIAKRVQMELNALKTNNPPPPPTTPSPKQTSVPPQKPSRRKRKQQDDGFDRNDDGIEVNQPSDDEDDGSDDETFEVDRIVSGPDNDGNFEVKLLGYESEENTMEPGENLPRGVVSTYLKLAN